MEYLGVGLCSDLENIIPINMTYLIQKIKTNLDKWKSVNLTLWG